MGGGMNRMDYLRQLNGSSASYRRAEMLEEAFAGCQDRLLGMLYYLLGNREDAERAFQEAFAKCLRRLENPVEQEHLEAWIFRVSLNVGRDLRSSAWRRRPLADDEPPTAVEQASGAEPAVADPKMVVRRALLTLGREEQEVFLLRQNGRMTYDQIAQAVNISLNSVRARMQLALARLREALPVENPAKSEGPGQRLLELAYDLPDDDLPPTEAAVETPLPVAAEPEAAPTEAAPMEAASTEAVVQQVAELFAEAARLETPKVELRPPHRAAVHGPLAGPAGGVRAKAARSNGGGPKPQPRRLTRGANWAVAVASLLLLLVSVGGFSYHRGQLADIAAENLRLLVVGPARLRAGLNADCQEYTVITTSVTGTPVSAQVEFAVFPPVGERVGHLQRTDDQGRLRVTIPDTCLRPGTARLEIRAQGQNQMERVETQVTIEPPEQVTHLSLDKSLYRPGGTVRYRSLTLSRFWLTAVDKTPIRFEIVGPNGTTLAGSVSQGITDRGMGCGQFTLPSDLTPGSYTLVAKSLDGSFPTHRKAFLVRADQPSPSPGKPKQTAETAPSAGTKHALAGDPVEVKFFPEGGELVAEMENRVYFAARDAQGRPLTISGKVLDSGGRAVARLETAFEGMGTFAIEPRVGELYRLKIEQPESLKIEPRLPEVATANQVVLTTGLGVFPAGKPLEFNVRASEAGIPLVATAWCRGVTVGEQALVTEATANSVSIPLVDEPHGGAGGVIRGRFGCALEPLVWLCRAGGWGV